MSYEVITLNLIPSGEVPVIHAAQFDVNRPLMFALKLGDDDFDPSTYDLELQIRKVDNNIVTAASASISGNVVTFNTTEQMTACSGTNLGEIQITKDDLDIATLHFYLVVQRDVLAGGVSSASDIYNLTEQIAEIVPQVIGDDYYNKEEVDEKISEIPTFDPTNYYDKSETDALLDDKANVSDLPDMTDYYNKSEVDTKITDLYQIKTVSGDIAHFIDGGDDIPVKSFECAIGAAGFSQADIIVCGLNLWNEDWESGRFTNTTGVKTSDASWIRSVNFIPVKPNNEYYFVVPASRVRYFTYDADQTFIGTALLSGSAAVTFGANVHYINIQTEDTTYRNNISVNFPSSNTQYNAYNGTTYIVEFGSTFNAGVLHYKNGEWYIDVSGVITSITSSTRIKTISGKNNIFSNTGDVEVEYFTEASDGIAELIKAFM